MISRFQDIAHFKIFPLTAMLKFQTAIIVLNFSRSPIYTINFYSLMTTLFITKFGSGWMKTGGSMQCFPRNLTLWMDRRTTDTCATTVALLTKSSKAKNRLEIWWIATFPQNLALISLMVSEKTRFTLTVGRQWRSLCHSIISAYSVKKHFEFNMFNTNWK